MTIAPLEGEIFEKKIQRCNIKNQNYSRQHRKISLALFGYLLILIGVLKRLTKPLSDIIFDFFVDENHLLRRVDRGLNWYPIQNILGVMYKVGEGLFESIAPNKLLRLFLALFLFRIPSERELVRRAKSDLSIRWFCGFGLFGPIPSTSTLSRFRERLGVKGFMLIFAEVLRQCIKAGLVGGETLLIDSSALHARSRRLSPKEQALMVLQEVCQNLFDACAVEAEIEEVRVQLDTIVESISQLTGYKPRNPGKLLDLLKIKAQKLGQPVRTIREALKGFSRTMIDNLAKGILAVLPHAVGDRDARIGRTSEKNTFCGYLTTIGIDGARHVVTSVVLAPGNCASQHQVHELYQQHKEHMTNAGAESKPKRAIMDSAFDFPHVHGLFDQDGVCAFISPRQRSTGKRVLPTDLFKFNTEGELTCPTGKSMRRISKNVNKNGKVIFEGTGCSECRLLKQCTTRQKRRVKINLDEHLRRQSHLEQAQSYEHKKAMIERLIAEGAIGTLKNRYMLRKAFYQNWFMNEIQCLVGITCYNIAKLIQETAPVRD